MVEREPSQEQMDKIDRVQKLTELRGVLNPPESIDMTTRPEFLRLEDTIKIRDNSKNIDERVEIEEIFNGLIETRESIEEQL